MAIPIDSTSSLGSTPPIDYRQYQHNKSNKRIIVTNTINREEINTKRQKKKQNKKRERGTQTVRKEGEQ